MSLTGFPNGDNFPELRIETPEGYQIDKENSTFNLIKFKKIEPQLPKQLPKSWDELVEIEGYWVNGFSDLHPHTKQLNISLHKNIFYTKEQAEASIALAQLSQLRQIYRGGWEPDWENDEQEKWVVDFGFDRDEMGVFCHLVDNVFISFQSQEIAKQFLDNFHDLIIKTKPLMS